MRPRRTWTTHRGPLTVYCSTRRRPRTKAPNVPISLSHPNRLVGALLTGLVVGMVSSVSVPARADGPVSSDVLAQQDEIDRYADEEGLDPAEVEAMLRRHNVPADLTIELESMELVEANVPLDPDRKVDRAPALAPIVRGSCGTSWVGIDDVGARLYSITTGFEVNQPAVGYWWKVRVTNPYGFGRNHRWSGGLAARYYWEGFKVDDVSRATRYSAKASGYAIIYGTNAYCYSKHPTDSHIIN